MKNSFQASSDRMTKFQSEFYRTETEAKSQRISKVVSGVHIPIEQGVTFRYRDELFKKIHRNRTYYLRLDYSVGYTDYIDLVFVHSIDLVKVNRPIELTIFDIETREEKTKQYYDFSFSDSYLEAFHVSGPSSSNLIESMLTDVTLDGFYKVKANEPIQIFRTIYLPRTQILFFLSIMMNTVNRNSLHQSELAGITDFYWLTRLQGLDPVFDFTLKICRALCDYVQLKKLATRCPNCGIFIKYKKNKKYCSPIVEGRDCGKSARNKRGYEKNKPKRQESSRNRVRLDTEFYKKHNVKPT